MLHTDVTPSGKPRKRRWFKFTDGNGDEWKVWLVLGRLKLAGSEVFAFTDRRARSIQISARQTETELISTLFHEFIHAACGERKRSAVFTTADEGREMVDYAAEESIARLAEHGLASIVVSLGFQLPALPPGVALKPQARS